ncbi:MAG: GTPase ObgE, partial [Thermoanaerobaculia bacterium]
EDLATVEEELGAFDSSLLARPRFVVGSKLDAAREERRQALRQTAEDRLLPCFEISSHTGAGVRELVAAARRELTRIARPGGEGAARIPADAPSG